MASLFIITMKLDPEEIAEFAARAGRAAGRLIIRHRHDIADCLMVVAVLLKAWPETLPLPGKPKRRR